MKIIVPAIGSRGDVQPFISLCQGLQAAGHQVILATNPTLCKLVRAHGVEAAPVGPPVDMGAMGAKIWAQAGRNWWLGMMRIMQLGFQLVKDSYPDLIQLVQGADLVVVTDTYAGAAEADKLGVPWVSVTLQPARVPVPNPDAPLMTRLIFPLVTPLLMRPMNQFRKQVGAPPVKDMGAMLSPRLTLIPVSPRVSPPHPLWPPHVQSTGYWFAREDAHWQPPADLLDFLKAGETPIAVSLGAMSLAGEQTRQAARITLEAIAQAGVRAVVQGWQEALANEPLPETIYHAGSLPHGWLFQQVRAVIHHGGFGTTAAGLRAGVPAVVIPHIIDQIYWAQKVNELGAGPKYIHRADLKVEPLAQAIRQAVTDKAMQARAAEIGQAIRAEPDSVQTAVQLLEDAVKQPVLALH